MICKGLTREQCNSLYLEILNDNDIEAQRKLCREDLFFLLTIACKRHDINRDWLFDRCREVESAPNGYIDIWAREHYKSTIITFGKSIQDVLCDPEVTIGIFSHTRPIAKSFLAQIKTEFEQNRYLISLFPEILYSDPKKESPRWSLDVGLRVKRKTNPKEETIEAWGLVDGQPTGKHFTILVYDDVVTRESVTTPEQIKKTTDALELSYNLGANGGSRRFIGTRYHLYDSYRTIMERETAIPRIHPATKDGTMNSEPVLLTKEDLLRKRRDMGPYTFSCQMLQNPVSDRAMAFKEEWLKYYRTKLDTKGWNLYLLVDPANEKKANSDYTVMLVIGLAPDNNYYLVDGIRDRLNLSQRTEKLFEFHRKYQPLKVGYEKYGKDADIEHMKYVMEQKNYRFSITPLGGQIKKNDRILRLVPVFEQGRFYLPEKLDFTDYEGREVDLVSAFIKEEYLAFPVVLHDDMLDCAARILDQTLGAEFPKIEEKPPVPPYVPVTSGYGWMG